MLKSILTLSAALALCAGAAHAADAAKPKPQRSCFWSRDVSSWSAADERTVYIRVGVKDIYRLDLLGTCPDIDWNWKMGLSSHGSSSICSPLDADIVSRGPLGPQRCPVKTITKLTPEQAAALPPKQRP